MKNFEKIFELIPGYPGSYISLICPKDFDGIQDLQKFCNSIKATLHVNIINEDFSYEDKKFNKHAVQYDFVFLIDDIEDIMITKKIYRILKNAGHTFILCKKDSTCKTFDLLENSNFVALNQIDLDDKHDIISAKKMHGWMRV
ncbi:hypothetical protein ACKGJI_09440 [Sulfurospirillum sp. 1307]|jgi:hypothetical protein